MRSAIEAVADNRVTDLHVWPIGSSHYAAVIAIVTHYPQPPDFYKDILKDFSELKHVSVEIIHCLDEPCIPVEN